MCLLLSVRPDQSVDLGGVSVAEFLHSLLVLGFVGLDIHSELSVLPSVFSMADSVVGGTC